MKARDAAAKAVTLADATAFAAMAPTELKAAADDLVSFWNDLVNNPSSVTANDPRLINAATALNGWHGPNCG